MALEDRSEREAEITSGDLSEEDRLVVATFPGPIGVDRDRHDHVPTDSGVPPAGRQGGAQRQGEAPLASVLEGMERGPNRAGERAAPFELN